MRERIGAHLTYANVVASLCLFLVLGGGAAFAATRLPGNSVGTGQLQAGAVTAGKIARKARAQLRGNRGPAGAQGPQGKTARPAPEVRPGPGVRPVPRAPTEPARRSKSSGRRSRSAAPRGSL